MNEVRRAVFVERRSYRRRRLTDAMRLLPVLGVFLWLIPLFWTPKGITTSEAILYIFAVWFVLVLISAGLSRLMQVLGATEEDDDGDA